MQVVAFSRCLHRNESVFKDANKFVPDRWLRPEKVETREEKEKDACVDACEEWYWAFGSGSRMCLASNLAMECKLREGGFNVLLTVVAMMADS